ncbi:unnamed protein product [Arabidopsis lyrata]|uniref:Predicted protein n=1 Tax=Arabidopsis lyrata subsp. lyrata TaxID=81972 RepID=D7M845_ARALL|nr:predicted protein [Arabidopsis lyrata subsp. lyrata]CAH8271281.1 unnamed protein product [Arabidopsis lyrata]
MIIHSSSSLHGSKFLNRFRYHNRSVTRSEARGFNVTTTRKEVVVAAPPLLSVPENQIIPLSNLDLLLLPVDINVCLFYKKPLNDLTNNDALKTALAEALASYIAKFVPMKKHGVFTIQVTELKCGSLVVGCTFDHRPTTTFLIIDSSIDQLYMPITSLTVPQEITNPDNILTSRIYYIKADVLEKLQTLASNGKRTKLESFSAFLWKLLAKHAATDSVLLTKNSKLGIVVDGRKKLMEQEENCNYFGNILSVPFGEQKIDDLIHKPLSWVTDEVHKLLESTMTKDHFLNLIDWIETRRPIPVISRIYGTGFNDGPAFCRPRFLRHDKTE